MRGATEATLTTLGGVPRLLHGISTVHFPSPLFQALICHQLKKRARPPTTTFLALSAVTYLLSNLRSLQRIRDVVEQMISTFESRMFAAELGTILRGQQISIDALGSPENSLAVLQTLAFPIDVSGSMFASLALTR